MYKFLLSENRILFAITEDVNKMRKLASEISWFREYDNIVIALGVDKKSSAFYKICKTSLVKEKLVSIPRNINEFRDGMFSSLTYDEVIAIEFQEPYLVYVVRKNCSAIEFAENQIDSLVVTDIETKETKAICEWNVRGEAGCQGIISKADFIFRAISKMQKKSNLPKTQYYTETEVKELITQLCEKIYPYYAARGIKFPQIKFRKMVSQWGNCYPKKSILTFNTNLMYADRECIEYVVYHEFTHFLQTNHSSKFYDELEKVCPNWKECRKRLKEVNIR